MGNDSARQSANAPLFTSSPQVEGFVADDRGNAVPAPARRGRLIVVSNRVAVPGAATAGGLATAMDAALREAGGWWAGWSGRYAEPGAAPRPHSERHGEVTYLTLDFEQSLFEGYYAHFANRVLWPLLHTRPSLIDFDGDALRDYLAVNDLFAREIAAFASDDDTIWIHDYHLLPLGEMLRERGVGARIGFFLHTPLPSAELMASIPHHRDLFGALAAMDLVGFQTQRDARSFATYAREYLRAVELDGKRLRFRDGRTVVADAFPIGIDAARVAEQARGAATLPELNAFRASLAGKQVVIGVDRLDYSKGLPRRVEAFGRLLQQHTALQRQVSLLQIAPLSRTEVAEYRDLRRHLERVIGAVNSAHATADWVPVRYVNASIGHDLLMGYYRASRAGMVTPWRDGMNLVAKEYIAAQDPEDPGVLILSAGAGASEQLTEALVVNPLDIRNMADAMHKALTMPLQERRRRWEASMRNVSQYDVHFWCERFLAVLRDVSPR